MEQKPNSKAKKFSIADFKATAQAVESSSLLEMITGGVEEACHVTSGGGGGGGGTFTSFTQHSNSY